MIPYGSPMIAYGNSLIVYVAEMATGRRVKNCWRSLAGLAVFGRFLVFLQRPPSARDGGFLKNLAVFGRFAVFFTKTPRQAFGSVGGLWMFSRVFAKNAILRRDGTTCGAAKNVGRLWHSMAAYAVE